MVPTCLALLALHLCTSALAAQVDVSTLTRGFSWREVGPANPAGRIVDVEAVAGASHIIYAGAVLASSRFRKLSS